MPLETSAHELNDILLGLEPEPFPTERAERVLGTGYATYLKDYYDDLQL